MRSTADVLEVGEPITWRPTRWAALAPGVCTLLLAAGCVVGLMALPFSTSRFARVGEAEVLAAPGAQLRLGPLEWDLGAYRTAPALAPFRQAFEPACGDKHGLLAARCVSDFLSSRSPRGTPGGEFVDVGYDPAAALKQHLDGEPGHCTVRASMTATALLAMGVPARVVQIFPPGARGHNLLEVWDAEHGWVLFDPYFDSSMLHDGHFMPALSLTTAEGGLTWRRPHDDSPDPNHFAGATIQYPEPWLYTRVGERCAQWPFRGCFAQTGPRQLTIGPAQQLALTLAVAFALASAVLFARAFRRRA